MMPKIIAGSEQMRPHCFDVRGPIIAIGPLVLIIASIAQGQEGSSVLLTDGGDGTQQRPSSEAIDDEQEMRTAAIARSSVDHPLLPAIRLAQGSLEELDSIADYEATFVKKERIRGQLSQQTIRIRLREKPFSVYLRYEGELTGREILFVRSKNNNQLLAHEGSGLKSLVGTVSLATDGVEAMQDNRYPITMIGMRNMLETVLEQWQTETRYGEVDVRFFPNANLGGRHCQVIESTHPQPRRQFRFHRTRLFIDVETRLPVRVEQYGFPPMPGGKPRVEEEYTYANIRTNVGLGDRDFSTSNPDYNF
jgi:hypothetical protein